MSNTVPVIGIDPEELAWIRTLVWLLRHPDPVVPELARQALLYLEAAACGGGISTRIGRPRRSTSDYAHA